MIDVRDVISKSKLAYKYEQNFLDSKIKELQENVTKDNFDFSLNKYRIFDGRLITQYNELSTESIILLHLKYQLRRAFNIQFPNRNKMIDELFNQIRICSSLSDFTIVKFDLKKYFYSISTEYIYNHVWSKDDDSDAGYVWIYISYLKQKLKAINANVDILGEEDREFELVEV